jgi:large subunit ribosomal protein L17
MHRHGYKGRKLHRERDQRRALLKGLADSLVKYEAIETTLPKAKELVPYAEKLITKAKKGDLHSRRQIIASLQTIESAHKLVDELAPRMTARNSGHLRINPTRLRRGDNAQMARVSFVDDLKAAKPAVRVEKPAETKAPVSSTKKAAETKKPSTAKKPAATKPKAAVAKKKVEAK